MKLTACLRPMLSTGLGIVAVVVVGYLLEINPVNVAYGVAGINRTLNFQGKLVDNNNLNVADSTYTVVFTIYDRDSGGSALWSETQSVTTSDGTFRVSLGSVTPIPSNFNFNWDGLYLGMKVGADTEMTPRIRLTAVPYAFNAEKVAGLTVQDENGVASTSGTLKIPNGKVVSFGGAFATSGTSALTLTTTNTTNATLPEGSITLVDQNTSQTLTSKTIGSTGLVFSGATTDVTTGTDENFTITPNGIGNIVLSQDADSAVLIGSSSNTPAVLSVSGGIGSNAALAVNQTNSGDILTASSSGVTKFTVKQDGTVQLDSTNYATCNLTTDASGNVVCATGGDASLNNSPISATTLGGSDTLLTTVSVTPTTASDDVYVYANLWTNSLNNADQTLTWTIYANSTCSGSVLDQETSTMTGANNSDGPSGYVAALVNNPGTTTQTYAICGNSSTASGASAGGIGVAMVIPGSSGGAGGAGSSVWSDLTAPSGNLALNMSTFTTGFNWTTGTSTKNLFSLTTDASANGTGALLNVQTGTGSTVLPLRVRSDGTDALMVNANGNVGIGTTTPKAKIQILGNANSPTASVSAVNGFAGLVVDNDGFGDLFTASKSGATKFTVLNNGNLQANNYNTAGGVLYTDGSGQFLSTGVGGGTQCLLGGTTPTWGSCAAGSGSWDIVNGVITPQFASTVDLLIGGVATNSAKFSVTGINGTGAATASVSGNLIAMPQYVNGLPVGGNLGIGTTSPTNQIHVKSIGSASMLLEADSDNVDESDVPFIKFLQDGGANRAIWGGIGGTNLDPEGNAYQGTSANGYLLGTIDNNDVFLGTNATVRVKLDRAGNVGIGTSNPLARLHIRNVNLPAVGKSLVLLDQLENDDIFTASASGQSRFTITNAGGFRLGSSNNEGVNGNCLLSGGPSAAVSWGSCGGSSQFDLVSGALTPKFASTTDLLMGGVSSSSAKFAVLNINNGTPVASVSGTTLTNRPGISLAGDGTIQSLNMGTLNIGGSTTGNIQFSPGNASTPTLTLLGNGNVGIGTTAPATTLDVVKSANSSQYPLNLANIDVGTAAGVGQQFMLSLSGASSERTAGSILVTKSGTWSTGTASTVMSDMTFSVRNNDVLAEQMRLTAVGNLGIGTTTPTAALDIAGTTGASTSGILAFRGSTNPAIWALNGNNLYFATSVGGDSGATTRLTLLNNGFFGIGTVNPNGLFVVNGTANQKALTQVLGDGNQDLFTASVSGSTKFLIDKTGNVGLGTTAPRARLDVFAANATTPAATISATSNFAGLIVDNSGNGDVLSASTSGQTRFTVKRDGTLSLSSLVYKSCGALATDTNGGVTCSAVTSSQWTDVTGGTYYNSGNVGIGVTTTSFAKLDVLSSTVTNLMRIGYDASNYFTTAVSSAGAVSFDAVGSSAGFTFKDPMTLGVAGSSNGSLTFQSAGAGIGSASITMDNSGNLTIATTQSGAAVVLGSGTGNINFTPGTNNVVFNLASTGDLLVQDNGATYAIFDDTGNIGIGTTTPGLRFDVRGANGTTAVASFSATTSFAGLVVNNDGLGDLFTASKSGAMKFTVLNNGNIRTGNYTTAGGIIYTDTTGQFLSTGAGSSSNCLVGGAAPSWGSCGGGSSQFDLVNGALTPKFATTTDLLLGGVASNSAKFSVLNINSGTPVASVSATSTGKGLSLGGDGVIQTLRNNNLTLGGNTTGAIQLAPNNTTTMTLTNGNVGIGDTAPTNKFEVVGGSALFNANGTGAAIVVQSDAANAELYSAGDNAFNYNADGLISFKSDANGNQIGTTNDQIQFFNGSNYQTMTLDTNGNVGIGNTAPVNVLAINGVAGNNAVLAVNANNNTSDIFTASASGTTRFIVQNNGNVGICNLGNGGSFCQGNTVNAKLEISLNNSTTSTGLQMSGMANLSSGTGLSFGGQTSGTLSNFTGKYLDTSITRSLTIPGASAVTDSGTFLNLVRTDAVSVARTYNLTGNLVNFTSTCSSSGGGVCTDSSTILNVAQNYASASGTVLAISNSGLGNGINLQSNSGGQAAMVINDTSAGDLFTASSSGTTKFVINNSGNVGIGTTAPTAAKLVISDSGSAAGVDMAQISATTGTSTNGVDGLQIDFANAGSSANTNAGLTVNVTSNNTNASANLYGINIGNLTSGGEASNEVALNIGTGWDQGIVIATGNNDGTGLVYTGTGRPTKTVTLSPEYPGAVLTASGSAQISGNMTSDASPSANFRTYYEWKSTTTGTLQNYTVAVRVTLPADFSDWSTSSTALQVNFNTLLTTSDSNRLDVYVYNPAVNAATPVSYRQAQVSGTAKTWTTVDITRADLIDSPAWNTAGQTAVIYLKMSARDANNYVQVGDIVLNYLAKF